MTKKRGGLWYIKDNASTLKRMDTGRQDGRQGFLDVENEKFIGDTGLVDFDPSGPGAAVYRPASPEKAGVPHRPHGRSMALRDAPIVERMRAMVEAGEATGPYDAATKILNADPSLVGTSFDSTRRRLTGRYGE